LSNITWNYLQSEGQGDAGRGPVEELNYFDPVNKKNKFRPNRTIPDVLNTKLLIFIIMLSCHNPVFSFWLPS
jgi:hypothetical protein